MSVCSTHTCILVPYQAMVYGPAVRVSIGKDNGHRLLGSLLTELHNIGGTYSLGCSVVTGLKIWWEGDSSVNSHI